MIRRRRTEWLLFACAFLAFGWFHQGGGWNQNARFALVRAIVERGTFFIDSHLVYLLAPPDGSRFQRPTISDGEFQIGGDTYSVGWRNDRGRLVPIAGHMSRDAVLIDVGRATASGDVAFHNGHFDPNKAPGTSLVGVPAYFVQYHLERAFGGDPDAWGTLAINAWLTSLFSVGLLSAFGVVLMYRFARRLTGDDERCAVVTALMFSFGTMFFPYATMMFEHNIIAVLLLAAWYLSYRAREEADARKPLLLAGLCAGYATITNYIVVFPLLMIALYIMRHKRAGVAAYGLGVLAPFVMICIYNVVCFGTPFTTNYRYENPMFLDSGGALLGVVGTPSLSVMVEILVSPFRGLFITAPVLLLGLAGFKNFYRRRELRSDAILSASIVLFFVLFNISFNGWHGGWAAVPRYLGPAMPFLALWIAFVYRAAPKSTWTLGALSIAVMLLITAVDAQPPLGNSRIGATPGRAQWTYNPVTEYVLPLLARGRVSVNPIGVYEADFYQRFPPHSPASEFNSFNAGELLAARGVWSIVPMILLCGALGWLAFRTSGSRAQFRGSGNALSPAIIRTAAIYRD
jgi:hypothetical protein